MEWPQATLIKNKGKFPASNAVCTYEITDSEGKKVIGTYGTTWTYITDLPTRTCLIILGTFCGIIIRQSAAEVFTLWINKMHTISSLMTDQILRI